MPTGYGTFENENDAYEQDPPQEFKILEARLSRFAIESQLVRECLAEILGTMIFIAFGDGSLAAVVLSQAIHAGKPESYAGNWLSISIGWGIALCFGIFVAGGVSGGHLNPAVTFTFACFGQFPWKKVPFFMISQLIGAFLGALMVYGSYWDSFWVVGYGRNTAGIFATYPQPHEENTTAFLNEALGTAVLVGGIFAVCDRYNQPAEPSSKPVIIGLLLSGIAISFGWSDGFALNPARDLGPRIFSAMAGWGTQVFTMGNYYFWVPIVAPMCKHRAGKASRAWEDMGRDAVMST
eukprot:jgi/Mesvir1/15538/Mv03188-RA.1